MSTARESDCVVVGGGPAGMICALELARAGLSVLLLEKTRTMERTFRGESLSPDAVLLLDRVGVLDDIRKAGALVTRRLEISEGGRALMSTEFADYDYPQRFPMEVPQPTLLRAFDTAGAREEGLEVVRGAGVTSLLEEDGRVVGVVYSGPDGPQEVRADLVIAADGRYSPVLEMSGLPSRRIPLTRDVVWMRTPLPEEWDTETYRIRMRGAGHGLFIPTYPDEVRVGFNIPKGGVAELRKEGIDALHQRITELAPELGDRIREHVTRFADTSVLDIFTSQTPRWSRPGLVLIGDAAHTLTPILGQGVNHALVDGVTLAGLLGEAAHAHGDPTLRRAAFDDAATRFQAEREPEVAMSRRLQMRQERLFTAGHPLAVVARSGLYQAMHSSRTLRTRMLANAYFRLQRAA